MVDISLINRAESVEKYMSLMLRYYLSASSQPADPTLGRSTAVCNGMIPNHAGLTIYPTRVGEAL